MLRKTPSFFILIALVFVGCSIYESDGRKDFETRSGTPGAAISRSLSSTESPNIYSSIVTPLSTKCRKVNAIEFWLKTEFSPETHELLYSNNNLEIWQSLSLRSHPVKLDIITKEQMDLEICSLTFSDETHSQNFLQEYVKE